MFSKRGVKMNIDDIFLFLIGLMVAMLGYFLSRLSNDVNKLEDNLHDCQSHLPHQYVLKEDYQRDIDEIKSMLKRLFDKLEK